jgi:membrane protein DedA with SNARE-associated domain
MSPAELDLNALLLTWIITYGSPMIAGILFLGALGIPLPGTLLVIASGAFIRQGVMDIYTTPPLGLGGALVGDIIIYGLGRFARSWIQNRFGQSPAWQKAEAYFQRRGGIAIYLTRWLFTPLAIPTNLIAGSSGYPFWKFLLFDLTGEMTWILLYGGLGYAFGSQWELISEFISDFSGLLVGILVLAIGIYLLFRWRKRPAAETAVTAAP